MSNAGKTHSRYRQDPSSGGTPASGSTRKHYEAQRNLGWPTTQRLVIGAWDERNKGFRLRHPTKKGRPQFMATPGTLVKDKEGDGFTIGPTQIRRLISFLTGGKGRQR